MHTCQVARQQDGTAASQASPHRAEHAPCPHLVSTSNTSGASRPSESYTIWQATWLNTGCFDTSCTLTWQARIAPNCGLKGAFIKLVALQRRARARLAESSRGSRLRHVNLANSNLSSCSSAPRVAASAKSGPRRWTIAHMPHPSQLQRTSSRVRTSDSCSASVRWVCLSVFAAKYRYVLPSSVSS